MLKSLKRVLKSPLILVVHFFQKKPFCYCVSDAAFLKIFYYAYHKKKLDLNNPKTFSEWLQWLKLHDRKQEYKMMSDKYGVRDYIAKKIGEQYLIPLLGSWDDVDDIDFDSLPEKFVLKCNHDSAGLVICKDKKHFDIASAKKKLKKCLKRDYFWKDREDNYRGFPKKIVAEQYMNDGDKDELTDYKFFCFNGEPKFIQIDSGRFSDHVRNFYDTEWNFIDVQNGKKNDRNRLIDKPSQLREMLEIARNLSEGLIHVRVDLYLISNKIYFGELTFHHGGGGMKVIPEKYDYEWGSYIKI